MGLKKLKTRVKHIISKKPKLDFIFRFLWIKLYQVNYFFRYRRFNLEDTILFECFKGEFINDSPFAIYNELRGLDTSYSYIWVVNNTTDIPSELVNDRKVKFVRYGTKDYFLAYSKSKFWVVNCRIHSSILKKHGQKFIQCWHGTPLKKMAHDIKVGNNVNTSLDSLKYSYQREVSRLDYFLSPSQYATRCFMSSFNMKEDKVLEVGYPRNDALVRLKDNQAYISEVKCKLGLDLTKRVVLYAPTWRDNQFNIKTGKHVLKNILDDESFTKDFSDTIFLYRGHYFTRSESGMNNFIDVSDYSNLNDLFLVADVLITDYSSLFFDFLILEKQVIFYMPDLVEYANQTRGFYLDVTTDLPYSVAEDIECLKKQLNEKIIDIDKTVDFNKQYNPYEDGSSSLRVIKEVGII